MRRLGDLLGEVRKDIHLEQRKPKKDLALTWQEIFGGEVGSCLRREGDTLIIKVKNTIERSEYQFRSFEFMEKISKIEAFQGVQRLKFIER